LPFGHIDDKKGNSYTIKLFFGSPLSSGFFPPDTIYGTGATGSKPVGHMYETFIAFTKMEQPLPSLLFVVKSHKRFTRFKGSGAVPYQRSPFKKATRTLHTVT